MTPDPNFSSIWHSLPELASSISAIRRRQSDILVGNVVGSNLFNLTMVMGGTAVVTPFALSSELLVRDLPAMLLFTAVLVPVIVVWQRLNRVRGLLLLLAYGVYIALLA